MVATTMARSLFSSSSFPNLSLPYRPLSSGDLGSFPPATVPSRKPAPLSPLSNPKFPSPPKNPRSLVSLRAVHNGGIVETEVPIEKKFPPFPTVMDINQIHETLPHRFPFLLVDRVIEFKPGVTAVGIKNVTINDNFFPGHFPERPIMPGVLMIEAMAQVGGLVMLQPEVGGSRDNFFFAGIDKVRFRNLSLQGIP